VCKISQPFVTYLIYTIQLSDVTHKKQTSSDLTATNLFSRNREGMFQQDGARAHTSKATITWLAANIKHYIPPEDWPPNSLDLSPTENVWSIMAIAIYADPERSVTASIEAPSPKSMEINFSANTSKSYRFDA